MFYEGGTSCLRRCRFLGSKVGAPRVEDGGSVSRRCRLHGVKVPSPRVLEMIPKGLGDTFYTPLGMLPNTLGRYLNTPITGIGTSD
ncbi:MAG: hypothetical protein K6G46_02405 [Prevotella sp.]|nr:hypothetical protein [Prevotella sp.]